MTAMLGPLVALECRRALARGWLMLFRTLTALAVLTVALIALWYAWICVVADPNYRPFLELRGGLEFVVGLLVTFALVLAPAVMAGSLAGEKERGALGLLLTTRVSPREVVAGRFAGKLTQVAMLLLTGAPAIALIAPVTGSGPQIMGLLLLLPIAVGFGGGGLALAISAMSRRGRDALLSVYLLDLVFLLLPLAGSLGLSFVRPEWLTLLNPYSCLNDLIWEERVEEAWRTIGVWTAMGLGGLAVASWRLAPACLAQLDGARVGRRKRSGRRRRVPPLRERPMVWKELYVESAGTLGGLSWWVGSALALLLAGGSLAMGGVLLWDWWRGGDSSWSLWARSMLGTGVGGSSLVVSWLIEWAIGLRAAVTVASERERGTWDAILTSPLEAQEIVRAKLWGSLYALRWLFVAAVLAWTIAAFGAATSWEAYLELILKTLVVSAFMAAVGIRISLTAATSTRAMAMTIGVWLGSLVAFTILTFVLRGIIWITLFFGLTLLSEPAPMTVMNSARVKFVLEIVELVTTAAPYLVATLVLVGLTSLRFDRLAGRSAGGRYAVAAEMFMRQPELEWGESMRTATKPPAASIGPGESDPRRSQALEPTAPGVSPDA